MLQSEALALISEKICQCNKCEELSAYRLAQNGKYVPGEGMPNARILILGEAPGQHEQEQGRPFIGKAGRLLTNIIEACGWKREELFITNILKCRPPDNRDPEKQEADNCRPFLDAQIRVINPEWILCFGRIASINLLGARPERTMGSFRHEIHDYQGRKVICTYHPSYLLRNPKAKEDVWADLQPVRDQKTA